mgnify:CR=1 FL=1
MSYQPRSLYKIIEDINRDRDKFLESIQKSLEPELKKIGLVLINVNITDITDESGYIQAIGKRAASRGRATTIANRHHPTASRPFVQEGFASTPQITPWAVMASATRTKPATLAPST